ncbi:hypothetical protein BBO99_00007124 [Phytophthora kernoviae]|uniref:Centrosomal protein of 290kDa coiled-coil region domain-containing protein n=1 Tax=Phytophthora kernoviae TaxID=325452 RepID=A0A3R7G134_9STRA|nr:hypothetical protein BBI17_007096 [Phytophthora kernoviae]RLN76979.1 hypothetical protein BBO99_00007124 [Phytophthora kernoviae]
MASQGEAKGVAPTTGTRCSRPDCTSIREELELLRGDLLELEGENEQLHDQLTAFQSKTSAREVSTQQKLVEKDKEIAHLSDVVAGLTKQLQEQIKQSQEQAQKSAKPSPEKLNAATLEQESAALKAKNEDLEAKLKDLQAQVEREASAGLAAQRQVAKVEGETKDKRSELFTALKENEVLRAETVELQEVMKNTVEQLKEYEVLVHGLQDQLEAYRDAVDEQTVEITELHTKLSQLEQEKLAVEAKLIEMDEQESDVDALMSDARAKFDMEKAVLIAELDELRRKLKQQQIIYEQQNQQVQLKKEVIEGDAETDTGTRAAMEDLEKQLEMLQELRVRDKSTILELNQRVLQQQSDLESLAEHLDVDALVESAVKSALHKQKAKLEAVEQENITLKRRLKEQRGLVQDLELRQGLVEKQLAEAKEWNAKYEQKAGLEDVMKYQKKLRAQLEQQQQMNIKLRQDVNDQVEAAGKLYIAFNRLKAETGKPDTFEYDDLAIADHLNGQLAINEAVMKQMEIQIRELEAERLRFLQKLRDQARMTGGKLYEQHGLTTEQWGVVEDFIDRVKHTPEVAKRLLQTDYEVVRVRDEDQPLQTARSQEDSMEELERKLEISSEENTLLLKELEHLQNELEAARTEAAAVTPAAFESEDEMVQQVDFLRELNVCMDELVATEARNEELQEQLHQHEEVFQSLMDQHTVLYQHFFQMHTQYANAEIRLRNKIEHLAQDNKDCNLKCQRDSLVSGNEGQLRSNVIELTRKIAVYEVNEARLKRKYQQLHNEWRSSTEHNKLLQREWSEMEKTLKYRVLYLETWKQGADEMMERMEKTLEKSVLREFADKQQRVVTDVRKKYNALSEVYAEMHVKYLQMSELPVQLGRVQHELMVLQAEKSARNGTNSSVDPILQERIDQLENDLEVQTERVKELEEAGRAALVPDELVQSSVTGCLGGDDELRSENALLYERINEVEQLYECLALECAKYKDIATLAASQANVLSKRAAQEKGNHEQQEEQLRELMAASEDHAIVGELQHQLMQIKATYQQFLVQYDLVTETQQQTLLKNQSLELEMEKKAQELSVVREKSSDKLQTFENAMTQVKERDWMARNTKWEAFRKRLDALEDEMLIEQQRRKQLEKDLEDKQTQLPLLELRQQRGNQSEVGRLKSRVDALEARERLLMGQLEAATKPSGSKEKVERLQVDLRESKTLNEDLMRQLETIQSRIAELLRLNGELEAEKRELRCKYEDLQLDLQYARSGLPADGGRREHDNQREFKHGSSHSPLMRQKVGLYEKDQAELQQAAQATIASLKQLVEEKNTLINEYQRKLVSVRATSAQDKAQDRLETTQLNKKLYEENQRMIGQLKEAMSTISSMERSGKSKQALQAAQERHDHVLQEWKQAELALEGAKQSIRELQMEREVLRNERDLAEARAGEALEEIVLLKEKVVECERHSQKLEHQVAFIKRDLAKKEEKLKLLRDAIIKLKEEFLKAEDRHAIEIAKAQHAMNHDFSTRKRKEKEQREEEEEEWREEKTRLQSQIQMLQEKLALQKKKQDQQQRRKKKVGNEEKEEKESTPEADAQVLKKEIERLTRLLKEKVVNEARAVEALEKKIKILQAQNLALREASISAPAATITTDVNEVSARREKMDLDRKLQRRVDTLMLRLKEKQADVANKDGELERCNQQISKLQDDLQSHKAKSEKERLAPTPAGTAAMPVPVKQQLEELERQNAFLQEALALKRKEWEESFSTQMEKYEVQLQRLRRRLVQHGVPVDGDDSDADAEITQEPSSRLQREEHRFLVGQEVREELLVLGDELRSKEQEAVAKDTRLLELELEVESLRLEYRRLQRKSQRGGDSPVSSEHETLRQRRMKGGFGGGRGSSWAAQERLELEEVIENMKKVIEKLRAENDKLKKAAAKQAQVSPERVDALRRKLKENKDTRERLEAQVEKLQHGCGELKKDKLKLQQKLRAKTTSSTSSHDTSALNLQLKEKDRQLLQTEQELAELRHQVIQLEVQIERNVHNEDDEDTMHEQEERIKELQAQVLELEDENTKLTNELAAFDEDFFEEIEDLKYKYAQAVRDKRQLEKRLTGGLGGLSPASTSSRHHRRG